MSTRNGWWLAGGALLLLAGCEGGRVDNGGLLADSRLDGVTLGGVLGPDGGISASVEGERYHFTGDAHFTAASDARHTLNVLSLGSDKSSWSISELTLEPGQYRCGEAGLSIRLERDGLDALSTQAGGCELTVSIANLDAVQGVFHGYLVDSAGRMLALEEGRFQLELASAIPDLDADGVSDADDNCPYVPNTDQADSDSNERGDACEASEDESS